MDQKSKLEILEKKKTEIAKKFGKEALIQGTNAISMNVEWWNLFNPKLAKLIGKGVPKGRIMEVYGPEGSGKTSIATLMMAAVQKQGGICAMIDAEHVFDLEYAEKLGLNIDSLLISQPDSGEQALGIVEELIPACDFIVVDSVAALTPQAELDGEMGDAHMGLQARLMGQALRKIKGICSDHKCSILFTNQIRHKIGVMFGSPETTPGGKALKFYASVRLDIRKVELLGSENNFFGQKVKIITKKNKVGPPFKKLELDLIFGEGFCPYSEYIDLAVEQKIVDKSGSWYSYGTERIGQGRANCKKFFIDHDDIFQVIKKAVDHCIFPDKNIPVRSKKTLPNKSKAPVANNRN